MGLDLRRDLETRGHDRQVVHQLAAVNYHQVTNMESTFQNNNNKNKNSNISCFFPHMQEINRKEKDNTNA